MINKTRSKREHAATPVVTDRPERGREMISKTVPTDAFQNPGEGKGEVYHEGYVDGKLFLVPDSNLEAMRDIVNFKMRPRRSLRYKHQTSYEVSDYDHTKVKLTDLIDKIDDLPPPHYNKSDQTDSENEETEEENTDDEERQEKQKLDNKDYKIPNEKQQFQDTEDEDEQTSKDQKEKDNKKPENLTKEKEDQFKKSGDNKDYESEGEGEVEESLAKEDPIKGQQFKPVQAQTRVKFEDETDSKKKIETESEEKSISDSDEESKSDSEEESKSDSEEESKSDSDIESKSDSEGQPETEPTGERSSKDQGGYVTPIKGKGNGEGKHSGTRTDLETKSEIESEDESKADSKAEPETKPTGERSSKDLRGNVIPIKGKKDGEETNFGTSMESDEQLDLDSQKEYHTKPTIVRTSRDQGKHIIPIKVDIDKEERDSETRTGTETEEDSDLDSQERDQTKLGGRETFKSQRGKSMPIKGELDKKGTHFETRTDTGTDKDSDSVSRKLDQTKSNSLHKSKGNGGNVTPVEIGEFKEGTNSGNRTEDKESEQESEVDSENKDKFSDGRNSDTISESGSEEDAKEGSKVQDPTKIGGVPKIPRQEFRSIEGGTIPEHKAGKETGSSSETKSNYNSEDLDGTTGGMSPTIKNPAKMSTPITGGPIPGYKPEPETIYKPELDEQYKNKHGKVPNKHQQIKHRSYPESDKLYVRFLISGHFKKGKKPIYIIQEYNGENLFQDQKTDIFTSEKNGDIDILIAGKYFNENILEESNGKPIALKTKPNKIIIDKNKIQMSEQFKDVFNLETAVILVKGQFITNPVTNKVTPFIRLDVQRKYPTKLRVDEQVKNIHTNNDSNIFMIYKPNINDPFSRNTKINFSQNSEPFAHSSDNCSPSLSEYTSIELDIDLSKNKQVRHPENLEGGVKGVNDITYENSTVGKGITKHKNKVESHITKTNPKGEGFFNFLKENSIYKLLFDRKSSNLTSKFNYANEDQKMNEPQPVIAEETPRENEKTKKSKCSFEKRNRVFKLQL